MHNIDKLREIDTMIMDHILADIINGTLLLELDRETLHIMLTNIWEEREGFERAGIIVGDS